MDGHGGGVADSREHGGWWDGGPLSLLCPGVGLQEAEQHHEDVAEGHGHGLGKPVDALRSLLLKDLEEHDIEKTPCGQALEHEQCRSSILLNGNLSMDQNSAQNQ